jgi:hypothetical protein
VSGRVCSCEGPHLITCEALPRWVVTRTRPGDGAPSFSGVFRGGSANIALIRFLDRYPAHEVGTRVHVYPFGLSRQHLAACYVRGEHRWETI